jgi:hypothetical protein
LNAAAWNKEKVIRFFHEMQNAEIGEIAAVDRCRPSSGIMRTFRRTGSASGNVGAESANSLIDGSAI